VTFCHGLKLQASYGKKGDAASYLPNAGEPAALFVECRCSNPPMARRDRINATKI